MHAPPTDPTLSAAGADVAITYTSKDSTPVAKALAAETGTSCAAFKCEVSSSAEVNAMLEAVEKQFGRKVDIGVANAGITLWKDGHENGDDEFRRVFEVNTFGSYYFARALARSWLDLPIAVDGNVTGEPTVQSKLGKQILFISSISAHIAMTPQRQTAYNASKGAVSMVSKVKAPACDVS